MAHQNIKEEAVSRITASSFIILYNSFIDKLAQNLIILKDLSDIYSINHLSQDHT